MTSLYRSLCIAFGVMHPVQAIFSSAEKEQLERNLSSLRLRVEQIPQEIEVEQISQEIEQEAAVIRARFAALTPRLFPLAVAYLVPRKLV
ncbi:MAG: hypothetical protein AAFY72_09890 [Cyanobacteria bacterium J06649_4]